MVWGACKGRLLELSSGRLLVPLGSGGRALAAYSDDQGDSWKLSSNSVRTANGAYEPAAFETDDGKVVFMIRTRLGTLYTAETTDGGETFSSAYDSGLESPAAPCTVGRIPSTADILLVWNKSHPLLPGSGQPRTPLTTAISRDEGKTWQQIKEIEADRRFTYMYPSLAFAGEIVLILYSLGEADSVRKWGSNWRNTSLKLAIIPYEWFYE